VWIGIPVRERSNDIKLSQKRRGLKRKEPVGGGFGQAKTAQRDEKAY